MDKRKSNNLGTLLHVKNLAPNAFVNFSKDFIDLSFRESNHLIATGLRLEGKTLHMRALLPEWTAIFWLKWLTCSTRSNLPFYWVKVDYENRWGSLALLILLTKGDLEICRSALLMTSFPMLRWDDPFSRLYLSFSSLSWREDTENDLQDGVLD